MKKLQRYEVIQKVIDKINAKSYLEIGIQKGNTFRVINANRKVGVDVDNVAANMDLGSRDTFYHVHSNAFFELVNTEMFDVVFIDGDHSHKQSWLDVVGALDCLNPGGVIVLHDSDPRDRAAERGVEVYNTVNRLRMSEGLTVMTVDSDCGCGIVQRKSGETLRLLEEYKPLSYVEFAKLRNKYLNLVGPDEFLDYVY